jgi:hypothetical protein
MRKLFSSPEMQSMYFDKNYSRTILPYWGY